MEIRKYKELLKEKVVECELVNKSAERDREIS